MAEKITTLKEEITGNDVYPNVKEENIPDTIQRKLTSGDGINIENNQVSLGTIQDKNIPDSTNKEVAFNNGIKTNKVTDLNGYKVVEDDGSHIAIGNSSRITQIVGSASRPSYNGQDMALLTDTSNDKSNTIINSFWGRWRNIDIVNLETWNKNITFYDKLLPYYSDYSAMFMRSRVSDWEKQSISNCNLYFNEDFGRGVAWLCFNNFDIPNGTIYMPNGEFVECWGAFSGCTAKQILVEEGKTFRISGTATNIFANCPNLEVIGEFDVRDMIVMNTPNFCGSTVKSILIKNINHTISFTTTNLEREAVLTIFNNLLVNSGQTIYLSTYSYDLLSTDDLSIATGKGWIVHRGD